MDNLTLGAGQHDVVRSHLVLCFCTRKYFESKACARELVLSVAKRKPLVALLEPDEAKGRLTQAAIVALLTDAWLAQWDFEMEVERWGCDVVPNVAEVRAWLFAQAPIEWHRLTAFQDVTMRLLVERLLLEGRPAASEAEMVYLQGEAERRPINLRPCAAGTYHLFYSTANEGAAQLVDELRTRDSRLVATDKLEHLPRCTHALLYLTAKTWKGEAGEDNELQGVVEQVIGHGVHLLLAHELPSSLGPGRSACEFREVMASTPSVLRSPKERDGIYAEIATSLLADPWRASGLVLLLMKVAVTREELERQARDREASGLLGRIQLRLSLDIGTDQAQALLSRVVQRSDDQPGHGEDGLELGVGRSQRPRLSSFGVAIATTPRRATDRSQRA